MARENERTSLPYLALIVAAVGALICWGVVRQFTVGCGLSN
jgi:hypothetical protein